MKTWTQIAVHDAAFSEDSFSFSGLDGDSDCSYLICGRWVNAAGDADLMACPNSDLMQANYFREGTVSENSNTFSWRPPPGGDHPGLTLSYGGPDLVAQVLFTYLIAKGGAPRLSQSIHGQSMGSVLHVCENETASWSNAIDNVTSLLIAAFATSTIVPGGIGAGSHFELWAPRE